MLLLGGGLWVFCSDSVGCPPPPWVLEGDKGFSEVAWCKSASERARLLLVSSLLGTAVAGLEPVEVGGVWGAATPGIAPDCCLSLCCPGNEIWNETNTANHYRGCRSTCTCKFKAIHSNTTFLILNDRKVHSPKNSDLSS